MNSAYSILLVPVIGLALIVTLARGNCATVVGQLIVDVLCTLASRSRGGDLESIGFPFPFRTAGGYAYTVYYWGPALLADIFVLVLLALVGGYAVIGVRRVVHESRDKDLGKPKRLHRTPRERRGFRSGILGAASVIRIVGAKVMVALDSPRWSELLHAYGSAEDIPLLLRGLETAMKFIEWVYEQ